jgi:O-antigen ligase
MQARARAARVLEAVIFCALLSLIPLTAVPYGTVDEWWMSAFHCIVFVLTALWTVEGLLGGRWFVREHRLLAPLVPLLGFVFLQSATLGRTEVAGVEVYRALSADAFETRLVAFRFLALLLGAAMLLRYTSSRRRLGALVCAVVAAGVLSAAFGIVRQGLHTEGEGFVLPHLQPQLGYAQFTNQNQFAMLMELCLGLPLGLLTAADAQRRGAQLLLLLSAGVLLWPALVLSTSRGGLFGMFVQVVLLASLWRAVRSPRRRGSARSGGILSLFVNSARVVCLLLVVGVGVVWLGGEQLLSRVERLHGEVATEEASNRVYPRRAEMWQATWQMFKAHPFAGSGFGGYWLEVDRYYDATGTAVPQQAHNDYLEILAGGGLVCVAPLAWFVVAFVRRARRCLNSRESFRRAACFGALLGLCAAAVHSSVDYGLHVTANAFVCAALFVIATAHARRRDSKTGVENARALRRLARATAENASRHAARPGPARVAFAALCLVACLLAACATARAGLSRWYSTSPDMEYSLAAAEKSVRLSPTDPVATLFDADMLAHEGKGGEAAREFERTVALRPEDHLMWANLAFAREGVGDLPGALDAFREAARLAPFYALPRWQLGTALLRAGQRERACAELFRAAASDPEYFRPIFELFWDKFGGDTGSMIQAVPRQSEAAQVALADFFTEHGDTRAAAFLLRQAGAAAEERSRLVAVLISEGNFTEAYEVWSGAPEHAAGLTGDPHLTDGSFEADIRRGAQGFGWCVTDNGVGLSVALDTREPRDGARSLLLDFRGEPAARSPIVSQLILVEPNTRYRLSFAARTHALMTTGPPSVELADAGDGHTLTPPTLLTRGNVGWQDYAVEFVTGQATSAVSLTVRRQECPLQPCLIFGRVWLDDFSLRKF